MLNYWIMEQIVEERQNDYMKAAEAYRIACQVERGQIVHGNSLPRIVKGLGRLLFSKVRQFANRSTASPTEASADA